MKYPLTCITNNQKYGFCYRVKEALKLKFNEMGAQFTEGKISNEFYTRWLKNWYAPREQELIRVLLALRYIIQTNDPQSIKLEEVLKL